MKIYSTPTHYILNPDCHEIDYILSEFLGIAYRSMPRDKRVAFDMSVVETCSNKFFRTLEEVSKERQVSLININDKILTSLYLMNYDKFVKIYTNDVDMFEDKHEIINRRFAIV